MAGKKGGAASGFAVLPGMLRRRRRLCAAVLLATAGGSAAAAASQDGMKLLVDAMAAPATAAHSAPAALAVFLAAVAAESLLWRVGGWLGSRAVIQIGVDLRLDLFAHLTAQPLGYFAAHAAGALSSRIPAAAEAVRTLLSTLIWNIVPPCSDLLSAVILLATVSWQFAAALLLSAGTITGLVWLAGARGFPKHHRYYREAAVTPGEIVDVIGNIALVKAFAGRAAEQARLRARLLVEARAHQASWRHLEMTRGLHDLLLWVTAAVILSLAVRKWQAGAITTGDVILVATLGFRMLTGARELALSALGLGQQIGAVGEALQAVRPQGAAAPAEPAAPLVVRRGGVAFAGVSFGYEGRARLFESLDLVVPPGQRLGVVGASGAGKSTLLRLLQRLDRPQAGRILVDGQDIAGASETSVADAVTVVSQDVALFHRSVLDNIRYGRPSASEAEAVAAAVSARCAEFIAAMPAGLHTQVGDRGVVLSGGQRQRLAIARAMLKNAPIVLLDEATSALDAQSEIDVQLALLHLARGRTVIAVAHRLSTLMSFDRIVVMQGGRIVEDGSPGQLTRANGPFRQMWLLERRGEDAA